MQRILALLLAGLAGAGGASACQTALLLAIDVSASVDSREFQLQTHGLADALRDPSIAEALENGQSALALVQWSDVGQQVVSLPWTRMQTQADVEAFSEAARRTRRAFSGANTAVGNAIDFAVAQFDEVPDCAVHIIDISGDGVQNAGRSTAAASARAAARGIAVNGIAIELYGTSVTNFFLDHVITPGGFVMIARGYNAYPAAMREKIARELARVGAALDPDEAPLHLPAALR